MRKFILLLAGISAATGLVLILRSQPNSQSGSQQAAKSVDDLAHTLQAAWADHHTVV